MCLRKHCKNGGDKKHRKLPAICANIGLYDAIFVGIYAKEMDCLKVEIGVSLVLARDALASSLCHPICIAALPIGVRGGDVLLVAGCRICTASVPHFIS